MNELTRRQLLQRLADSVAAAGAVVLAQTVLAEGAEAPHTAAVGPDERADRLAGEPSDLPGGTEEYVSFLNRGFRNARGAGGGFRNGGFRNVPGPGGAFRNSGFRNVPGPGGAFRNGGFRNL